MSITFFDALRLRNAWRRKANEIDAILSREADNAKRLQLFAEMKALMFCAEELQAAMGIVDAEPVTIEGTVASKASTT